MTNQATTWKNLQLRLQSCAYHECRGHALSVVTVKLVMRNGELVRWTKPAVSHTEPIGGDGVPSELLTDEVLEALTT